MPLVDEEARVHALAHQPSLHVRERDHDGVDRTAVDVALQLVKGDHRARDRGSRTVPTMSGRAARARRLIL